MLIKGVSQTTNHFSCQNRFIHTSTYVIVVEKFHTVFVSNFHHLSHVTLIFDQIHYTLSYGFGSIATKQNYKRYSIL